MGEGSVLGLNIKLVRRRVCKEMELGVMVAAEDEDDVAWGNGGRAVVESAPACSFADSACLARVSNSSPWMPCAMGSDATSSPAAIVAECNMLGRLPDAGTVSMLEHVILLFATGGECGRGVASESDEVGV